MKRIWWMAAGCALLLLVGCFIQILFIWPAQARAEERNLERRGADIMGRSLTPEAAVQEAVASGLSASIDRNYGGFDQGYDGCDTQVIIWPKHNSDEPFRFRLFLDVKYLGSVPKKYKVLLYGNL